MPDPSFLEGLQAIVTGSSRGPASTPTLHPVTGMVVVPGRQAPGMRVLDEAGVDFVMRDRTRQSTVQWVSPRALAMPLS